MPIWQNSRSEGDVNKTWGFGHLIAPCNYKNKDWWFKKDVKSTFFVHTSLKVYQGVEVYLHSFVISALDRGVWSAGSFTPWERAPDTHIEEPVWMLWKREYFLPLPGSEFGRPAGDLVIIPTTLSWNFGNVNSLVTYLLTYSMVQSPSWEASWDCS